MLKDKIDSFLDLPVLYRVGSALGLFALTVGALYFFLFEPMQISVSSMQDKGEQLDREIQALRLKANRLPEYEAEVQRLDIELSKALKELPDRKEIDTLLARISDKAKDVGLDVVLFKPEAEIKRDFYAEVPVSLEVRGGFHQVASFFDEVSHLERIVNMTQFRIQSDSSEDMESLRTNVTATSFRFLDESERPKEEEKKGKRRKKK
ncbi:MAG TPA: type 4a pilus biogenesis protein PilO [Oligoflexia bacterium]|nr:type 4a pilus biogenesis protein PilO [Oligoflexia bacterium]HMP49340.1 type 4a pilus biogenesis protein PilO [Oligoflexia bacterium]